MCITPRHASVNANGQVQLVCLDDWTTAVCTLVELVTAMCKEFGKNPPVRKYTKRQTSSLGDSAASSATLDAKPAPKPTSSTTTPQPASVTPPTLPVADVQQEYIEELTCVICLDIFTDPVTLPWYVGVPYYNCVDQLAVHILSVVTVFKRSKKMLNIHSDALCAIEITLWSHL